MPDFGATLKAKVARRSPHHRPSLPPPSEWIARVNEKPLGSFNERGDDAVEIELHPKPPRSLDVRSNCGHTHSIPAMGGKEGPKRCPPFYRSSRDPLATGTRFTSSHVIKAWGARSRPQPRNNTPRSRSRSRGRCMRLDLRLDSALAGLAGPKRSRVLGPTKRIASSRTDANEAKRLFACFSR